MSKPEAIPQELYDRAWGLAGGCVERPYNQKPRHRTAMVIVRAILAAKAEERQHIDDLVDCLSDMTFHYVALAGCGDCGNWNPEEESEVIAARQMIARHRKHGEG